MSTLDKMSILDRMSTLNNMLILTLNERYGLDGMSMLDKVSMTNLNKILQCLIKCPHETKSHHTGKPSILTLSKISILHKISTLD